MVLICYRYYNSRYDLPKFINATPPLPANESYDYVTPAAEHLTRVASMLAKTLYTMSTGKSDSSHVAANNLTVKRSNWQICISKIAGKAFSYNVPKCSNLSVKTVYVRKCTNLHIQNGCNCTSLQF